MPEVLKDKRCKDAECSPTENLVLQVGWTTLQLKWEAAKFIYVNTIFSFERFGTQIRIWKEEYSDVSSERRTMDEGA